MADDEPVGETPSDVNMPDVDSLPPNCEDLCICNSSECENIVLSEELDKILCPKVIFQAAGQPHRLWPILTNGQKDITSYLAKLDEYKIEKHCCRTWESNYVGYRCKTCSKTPTMSLCVECFKDGNHEGHDYNMFRSKNGGACDCGFSIVNKSGYCKKHGGNSLPKRFNEKIPETLICIPKRAMPRIIHRLALQLRRSHVDLSGETNIYLDFLIQLANSSAVIRSLMVDALTNCSDYSSQILLLSNHPDRAIAKIVNEGLKKLKRERKGLRCLRLPEEWAPREEIRAFCDIPSINCFLDELLFYVIILDFPPNLLCFLFAFLMDSKYKEAFARSFVNYYPQIVMLSAGLKPEIWRYPRVSLESLARRALQISMQFYSDENLIKVLCGQEKALHVIIYCLRAAIEGVPQESIRGVLKSNPLASGIGPGYFIGCSPEIVCCDNPIIRDRHLSLFTEDLNTVLTFERQVRRLVDDEQLLATWMTTLSYFQTMNPCKRELSEHTPYDAGTHLSVFSIESDFCLTPLFSILSRLKSGSSTGQDWSQTRALLAAIHSSLSIWFHKMAMGPNSTLDPYHMSFHIPIHRMFAATVRHILFVQHKCDLELLDFISAKQSLLGAKYAYRSLDRSNSSNVISTRDFFKMLMMHPLQALTLYHETRSSMWTRNGLMSVNSSVTYVNCVFCLSTIDLDMFLLKYCASKLEPNYFIKTVLSRLHAWKWFGSRSNRMMLMNNGPAGSGSVPSASRPLYHYFNITPEQITLMVESCLYLLVQLLTLNIHCKISEKDQIRSELAALLSTMDRSYSYIVDMLPDRSYGGSFSDDPNFAQALDELTNFKGAHHGEGGTLQQGCYTLKPEAWDEHYDPILVQYRFYQKRDYQMSLDRFFVLSQSAKTRAGRSATSSSQASAANLWPPFKVPQDGQVARFGPLDLSPLIECSTILGVVYSILYKSVYIVDVQDSIVALAIHLLELSLRKSRERRKSSSDDLESRQQKFPKTTQAKKRGGSSFLAKLTYAKLAPQDDYEDSSQSTSKGRQWFGRQTGETTRGRLLVATDKTDAQDEGDSFAMVEHAVDLAFDTWFPFESVHDNCLVHIGSVHSASAREMASMMESSSTSSMTMQDDPIISSSGQLKEEQDEEEEEEEEEEVDDDDEDDDDDDEDDDEDDDDDEDEDEDAYENESDVDVDVDISLQSLEPASGPALAPDLSTNDWEIINLVRDRPAALESSSQTSSGTAGATRLATTEATRGLDNEDEQTQALSVYNLGPAQAVVRTLAVQVDSRIAQAVNESGFAARQQAATYSLELQSEVAHNQDEYIATTTSTTTTSGLNSEDVEMIPHAAHEGDSESTRSGPNLRSNSLSTGPSSLGFSVTLVGAGAEAAAGNNNNSNVNNHFDAPDSSHLSVDQSQQRQNPHSTQTLQGGTTGSATTLNQASRTTQHQEMPENLVTQRAAAANDFHLADARAPGPAPAPSGSSSKPETAILDRFTSFFQTNRNTTSDQTTSHSGGGASSTRSSSIHRYHRLPIHNRGGQILSYNELVAAVSLRGAPSDQPGPAQTAEPAARSQPRQSSGASAADSNSSAAAAVRYSALAMLRRQTSSSTGGAAAIEVPIAASSAANLRRGTSAATSAASTYNRQAQAQPQHQQQQQHGTRKHQTTQRRGPIEKDLMEYNESLASLLLRLHAKYSQRTNSYEYNEQRGRANSLPTRSRLGDGAHYVTIVLDLICTSNRRIRSQVERLSKLIWLPPRGEVDKSCASLLLKEEEESSADAGASPGALTTNSPAPLAPARPSPRPTPTPQNSSKMMQQPSSSSSSCGSSALPETKTGHQMNASERRRRAKEFQSKLMADFANKQRAFIEKYDQLERQQRQTEEQLAAAHSSRADLGTASDKIATATAAASASAAKVAPDEEPINLSSKLSRTDTSHHHNHQSGRLVVVGGGSGAGQKPQMSDKPAARSCQDKKPAPSNPNWPVCCICGLEPSEGAQDESNPLGQVVLLQSSSVVGHANVRPGQERQLPGDEQFLEQLRRRTYARHLERRIDLLCEHFSETSWLDSINIGAEGGVHVQSCGHFLHIECHQSYVRSLSHEDRLRVRAETDEFLCPLCRQLANSVLPILDDSNDDSRDDDDDSHAGHHSTLLATAEINQIAGNSATTEMDIVELTPKDKLWTIFEQISTRRIVNQRQLKSSAAFCSHFTRATAPRYRLVRSTASMHSLFLYLTSIVRTNLESELIVRSAAKWRANCISNKRTCFRLLFKVLALNAQTLIEDSWFSGAQTWSYLVCHSGQCHSKQQRLSLKTSSNEVPLLLRDPITILLQFLFAKQQSASQKEEVHNFKLIVGILFNLTVVQSVALVLSYERLDDLVDEEDPFGQLAATIQAKLAPLLAPKTDEPLMNSNLRSNWATFAELRRARTGASESQLDFIERLTKLVCLPFLRAAALIQHHLFGEPFPTDLQVCTDHTVVQADLVDGDFRALVECLNLQRPGRHQLTSGRQRLVDSLNWPQCCTGVRSSQTELITSWGDELLRFAGEFSIAARSLLLSRPLYWFKPALMRLPHSYDEIFMFYYHKKCLVCNQVPRDVAICLVCGVTICFRASCCKDNSRSRQVHSQFCGANTAILLAIHTSSIVIIRGNRACSWGSVYLDAHDEEDNGLNRGKPLYLVRARYELLEHQWLTHSFDHTCGKRWIYLHENQ